MFWQSLKKIKRLFPSFLFLPFFLGLFLRLFRLEQVVNFSADQGRDFLLVYRMIVTRRPTLLGPPTSISQAHFGPAYYYLLAPFLLLFRFDPLAGSLMTIFFDLLTLVLVWSTAQRLWGRPAALAAALFYATFPPIVETGRVSLNPFLTPFFTALFLYLLLFYHRQKTSWLLVGASLGLLFQLHYAAFFWTLLLFPLLLRKQKPSSKGFLLLFLGFVVFLSPMILFELRHQFFNTKMWLNFFQHPRLSFSTAHFPIHYFVAFWPLLALGFGWVVGRLAQTSFRLAAALVLVVTLFNLAGLDFRRDHGYTMPSGWNLPGLRRVCQIIASDPASSGNFNIAATLDGDTRALPYRYLLEAVYHRPPQGVEDYPQAETLFVVSRQSANQLLTNPVWEISSFQPATVAQRWHIQNGIYLYKLVKMESVN